MKKIKQTYFSHDSNARNDIKLIRLRSKYGYEGYGIYFALIELLFSEGNKLCIDDFETLAFGLQCDAKKLKHIINDFDLFIIEEGCFYSKRLDNIINEIESKSKKASDSAKKRWNNATALQPHSEGSAIKLNKNKSNKIKSNKSNYYNDIPFPNYYDIHYAKRIEQDVNKTQEYHKHLESLGYIKELNNYNGQSKWVKK